MEKGLFNMYFVYSVSVLENFYRPYNSRTIYICEKYTWQEWVKRKTILKTQGTQGPYMHMQKSTDLALNKRWSILSAVRVSKWIVTWLHDST